MNAKEAVSTLQAQMETSIIGQRDLIRQMIVGLLANGHLLLESLPGLAKTRAVKSMAKNLDADMRRGEWPKIMRPSLAGKRLGVLGLGAVGMASSSVPLNRPGCNR